MNNPLKIVATWAIVGAASVAAANAQSTDLLIGGKSGGAGEAGGKAGGAG